MSVARDTKAASMTVDDLARDAGLPVRTIREYQTMRLLPPPTRHGRIGLYGDEHRRRLELIARLQRRGYSLAGIKDLLAAWDSGTNLQSLLGVDIGPGALDETPLRLTRRQLDERLPGLSATALRRAQRVGLVRASGRNHFVVRSPALLALVSDGVDLGVRVNDMLDLVELLVDELGTLADKITEPLVERVWRPQSAAGRSGEVEAMVRRGRLLLLQGVVSVLADRLGASLARRADGAPDGDELRGLIDNIRVGAVADAEGNVQSWRTP